MGVGYEGLTLDEVVGKLVRRDVDTLIDVRLNAISRKRGFSKKALQAGLEEVGIVYLHFPALGNHRDNRQGYGETGTDAGTVARDTFTARLDAPDAQAALEQVASLAASRKIAVFCYEADQAHCHREQVIQMLDRRASARVAA